jgi:translocation and assembly module TamB
MRAGALLGRAWRGSLLALALLLAATGVAVAQREAPWAWLVRRLLTDQVPGLAVEGLTGTLTRDPRAARITLSDAKGVWLTLEDAGLVIDRSALFSGRLRLESVTAARGRLARLPEIDQAAPPPPAQPGQGVLPSLPQLPVGVQVDRLAVGRFEISEPVLGVAAALSLDGRLRLADGRLEAAFAADRLDAPGTLRLQLGLDPGADRLAASVTLDEPAGGLIGRLAGLPDQPAALRVTLDGPASGARLDATASLGPEVSVELGGTVRAGADGSAGADITGRVTAAPLLPAELAPLATPLELALDAALSGGADRRVTLRRLRAALPAGAAEARGTFDLATEAMDLHLDLALVESARFAAVLPGGTIDWSGLRGEARLTGTLTWPRIALDAEAEGFGSAIAPLAAALGPTPHLHLEAEAPAEIRTLRLTGAEATLTASGSVRERLDTRFALEVPNLAAIQPGVVATGAVRVEGTATGPAADPHLTLRASADAIAAAGRELGTVRLEAEVANPASAPRARARLDGRLERLPVHVALRAMPEGSLVRLEEAEASLGPVSLVAAGVLDPAVPAFDGTLRLDAPDLAPLSPLAGTDLAGRVRLEARLAPQGGEQGFDASLNAAALRFGGVTAEAEATLRGTPSAMELALRGGAAGATLSTRARLGTENDTRRLDIAALEARYAGETLRLTAPGRILLRPDGAVEVAALALGTGRGGSLQATGRWGSERADLRATLGAIPLALLAALGGQETSPVEGVLGGDIRATGPTARPEIAATLRATGLRSTAERGRQFPVAELRAEGTLTGFTSAQLRAEVSAGNALRLTATARLPEGFGAEAPLAATLDGNGELGPLLAPFLAAGADRLTGRVALALQADGTIGAPRLGGGATLSGGEYRNLVHGTHVFGLAGRVRADGMRLVLERLEGQTAGGGRLSATGAVDAGAPDVPAELSLTARSLRPVASDLVTATLDADLRFVGEAMAASGRLEGTVGVRRAEIRLPEGLPPTVRDLGPVRERGRTPPGTRAAVRAAARPARATPATAAAGENGGGTVALAIVVDAPRGIFVRGRGLDAELGGRLEVSGTLAEPVVQGELTTRRGQFQLLVRRLIFQRGVIRFQGDPTSPALDFLATARASEYTINVAIEGTPTDPKLNITSVPELPRDEALAQLLFGRSTSNLSPFQIAQLAEALAGFTGLPSTGGVFERLRRGLGLDRLGVGSSADREWPGSRRRNEEANPELEAGRYIGEGVYVGVHQGTEPGSTRVGVEIELTRRLRLQAETGTGGGGREGSGSRVGLSYEFEY